MKFETPELLQEKIEEYFALCDEKGQRPIITGLAYHLDTSRETLCNYEERDEFFDIVKRAKTRCEMALETNLVEGKGNPTGSIFVLKNGYGWRDKTESEVQMRATVEVSKEGAEKYALTSATGGDTE